MRDHAIHSLAVTGHGQTLEIFLINDLLQTPQVKTISMIFNFLNGLVKNERLHRTALF